MNLLTPVSAIMSTDLITVRPADPVARVKELIEAHQIHHLPVVDGERLIGIISQSDVLRFQRGAASNDYDKIMEATRLRAWRAEEIMTRKLAKVESTDALRTVAEVFLTNQIHALPVVDGERLVGLVTTYDLIKLMATEPIKLDDYKTAKV